AQAIRFFCFLAFLLVVVVLNTTDFYGFFAFSTLILLTVVILMAVFPLYARSALGYIGFQIGNNNNVPLYIFIALFLISLPFSIKYGAGEPVFLSTLRESVDILRPYYNEDRQVTVNQILYGIEKPDSQLEREKDFLKKWGWCWIDYSQRKPMKLVEVRGRFPDNWQGAYNERLGNWMTYNLFVSGAEARYWLGYMPSGYQIAREDNPEYRTWLYWKFTFIFFLLIVFCLPFSFSDEVARGLTSAAKSIRRKHKEFKSHFKQPVTPPPNAAPATGTTGVAGISAPAIAMQSKTSLGMWGKLIGFELTAEVIAKFLESIARFFARM
ncbi:MAG: hypothetical protein WCT39_07270, partial [Candidatus Margulisiibacteriota bacterium]